MRKLLFLLLVLAFILSVTPALFASAYQVDENTLIWGPGPDPDNQPDGQLWYTFADWSWVEGTLSLNSAWPGDPNTMPWPGTFSSQLMGLDISAIAQINGILVVSTGYKFDLATAGITGKVISNVHIINAFWNMPSGVNAAVAPAFYDEDDNLVYKEDPSGMASGWWQGVDVDFSDNPSKTVRFMIDPYAATWVWNGNKMYIESMIITLIDEEDAKCGTKYNPSQESDITGDCIVDVADIALLANYWLSCNDPADAGCVE